MLPPKFITNWTPILEFNTLVFIIDAQHADQFLSTIFVISGFFDMSFLRRSLDPRHSPWSPLTNFLINTWFLWIGFYNFYLGMALCAFLVGFAIRHPRRSVPLALGLVALFFTHVLSLALALM